MEFDIISDSSESSGLISISNYFCREVKSKEQYTLLTFC